MSTPTNTHPDPNPPSPPDPFFAWEPAPPADGMASRLSGVVRTRKVPYLLAGLVLVLGCAAGGVVTALRLGQRQTVWALAQPVTVGHPLTADDLRRVRVAAGRDVAAVPAGDRDVLGRPLAYSLPAGALLTRAALGRQVVPPDGRALAALAVKAGQFPPELAAGSRVVVVGANAPSGGWGGTVTGVRPAPDGGTSVITLQLGEADARQVAAAPAGSLSLVAVSNGES